MARPELALALLAVCLLGQVVPGVTAGSLTWVSLLALPLGVRAAQRWGRPPLQLLAGLATALALCTLALDSPELWLQTGLTALVVVGGGVWLGAIERKAAGLAVGLGLLAPLAVGGVIASISPSAGSMLRRGLGDWSCDSAAATRFAQWLAAGVALLGTLELPAASSRGRWLGALAALLLGWVVTLRALWLATTLSLPTDMLVWSEPPLLLNLLKLHAGEVFYGPMTRLNSYSYSPAVEHVQYALLRPVGLELSLRAHRALGVLWQLGAASCWLAALKPWFGAVARRVGLAVAAAAVGLVFSSLLSPHLHPDHLLMLSLGGAYWLITREGRPTRAELGLLVLLPASATMVKLTGAGIGLGLAFVYAWERDLRRLSLLGVAGALALATIGLFDATLGHFSDYAIRLQASHPFDVDRALAVWKTPPLLLFFVALLLCAVRLRASPRAPAARAGLRVVLLTLGIGLPSLVAYAKHGGRENSLLPFTLGGALVLLLALSDAAEATASGFSPTRVYASLAALLALIMPPSVPVLGESRARMLDMHETATAWLARSARDQQRVFTASTAAYLSAGLRAVPDMSLTTISELALAKRPEALAFERRIRGVYYDSLLLSDSSLQQNPTLRRLLPSLQNDYQVVAPAELAGAWPSGLSGYVILERRAALSLPARAVR